MKLERGMVTVVIATHNRLELLKRGVESIKNQTYPNWELLIVDDHSVDGTWEWLQEIRDKRIRVFRQQDDYERSAARNRGIEESRGELIMFLDDDDTLYPRALDVLAPPLLSAPESVASIGARHKREIDGRLYKVPHVRKPSKGMVWRDVLTGGMSISGQTLFRNPKGNPVARFDPVLETCEDRDFLIRRTYEGPVFLLPEPVVEILQHAGQTHAVDPFPIRDRVHRKFMRDTLKGIRLATAMPLFWAERAVRNGIRAHSYEKYMTAFLWSLFALILAPRIVLRPMHRAVHIQRLLRAARNSLFGSKPKEQWK